MLIAHIEPPSPHAQGDQIYRTVQPCAALAAIEGVYVVSGSWLTPLMHEAARDADVLVLCQAVDADYLPLLAQRRAAGRTSVMEINDNFAAPQPWNSVAAFYDHPQNRSLTYQLACLCDALQVCSRGLYERFQSLNPRCVVWPNQVMEVPAVFPEKPARLRLGWGGSAGHRDDIAAILPVLRQTLAHYPDVQLAVMAPPALAPLFTAIPAQQLDFIPAGSLTLYRQFLASLHVGLAPLLPTEFNRCRSDVKFLEYASAGVAAVCSDATPYQDSVQHKTNGLLFANAGGLHDALLHLLGDPGLRQDMARAAWQTVRSTRLEAHHAPKRLAHLVDVLGATSQPGGASRFHAWAQKAGTLTSPRYLRCEFGTLEAHLYNGLLGQKDLLQPQSSFAQAARLAPSFYLPMLYAGQISPHAAQGIASLRRAQRANRLSCSSAFALAQRLFDAQQFPPAAAALRQTLRLAPNFAPAHEAMGRVYLALGKPAEARAAFLAALQANPHYREPARRLAVLALDAGDHAGALALLRDTTDMSWVDHYLLGDVYGRLRQWQEAQAHLEQALKDAPDPQVVRAQLAKTCLQQGDMAQARRWLHGPH